MHVSNDYSIRKRPVLGAESLSDDLYAFWEPLLKQCMSSFGQRRFGELLVLAIVDRLAEADLAHWESTTAGRTDVATEKLRQYSSQSYTFALALWAVRVIIDALASGTDVSTSAVEVRSGTMDTGGSAVLDADYMAVDDDDNDDAASLASMRSSSDAEADDDDDSYDETEADTDIVHFLKLLLRKPSKFTPFMFATIRRSLHDIPEFDEVRASRIKALLDAMAVKPTSVHADTELNADQAERLFEELIARKHVPPIEITDATVVVASSLTDIIATTATSIDPRSPWTIADPMHWREGCPMGTLPSAYCEYAGVSGEVIGDGTRLVFADEVNAVPVKPSAGYVFPDFGTCVQKFETIAR